MIQNSFIMLDRIGNITEKRIYGQGINDWDSFINAEKIGGISKKRKILGETLANGFLNESIWDRKE